MRVKKSLVALLGVLAWNTPYALAQDNGAADSDSTVTRESTTEVTTETTMEPTGDTVNVKGVRIGEKKVELTIPVFETYDISVPAGYRGVDDFFVVREANSNVRKNQFQLEFKTGWSTYDSNRGKDDDWTVTPSIKYGITDMINVELEVLPINIGDGTEINGYSGSNDGTGDLNLKLYWQLLAERDLIPALALWSETRIPTGEGSEKMDETVHLNLTKTVHERVRVHLEGFLKSANGARGDGDRDWRWDRRIFHDDDEGIGDRRHFQWGLGMGADYKVDEKNLIVLNYMNRSSEYYGNGNANILGAGWVHHLTDKQQIMVGLDYCDYHGNNEGPRWTTKAQYSISF